MELSLGDDSIGFADINKAPNIEGVARNCVLLEMLLEFFEVFKAKDPRAAGATIEPVLDDDRSARQRGLNPFDALSGENLLSIGNPVIGFVAIRSFWHRISVA